MAHTTAQFLEGQILFLAKLVKISAWGGEEKFFITHAEVSFTGEDERQMAYRFMKCVTLDGVSLEISLNLLTAYASISK